MGNVVTISSGVKGFDVGFQVITAAYAACIVQSPYNMGFVGRYVSLSTTEAPTDLSAAEVLHCTENGLAIAVFQHCYSAPSFPNYATQGTTDATTAISHLDAMGAPSGLFVYCDIENFSTAANAAAYAQAWANKINASPKYWAGYYGPQNVLNLISGGTFHGLWENSGQGPLTGANISQSGQVTPTCGSFAVDKDTMLTSLGGFWGF